MIIVYQAVYFGGNKKTSDDLNSAPGNSHSKIHNTLIFCTLIKLNYLENFTLVNDKGKDLFPNENINSIMMCGNNKLQSYINPTTIHNAVCANTVLYFYKFQAKSVGFIREIY